VPVPVIVFVTAIPSPAVAVVHKALSLIAHQPLAINMAPAPGEFARHGPILNGFLFRYYFLMHERALPRCTLGQI
jgi:hypothetical protein